MLFKRLLITLLFALFSTTMVHAAVMEVSMPLTATPENAVMVHCHVTDDDSSTFSSPQHPNDALCINCIACLPVLTAGSKMVPAMPARPVQHPRSEASYHPYIAPTPKRPPILA